MDNKIKEEILRFYSRSEDRCIKVVEEIPKIPIYAVFFFEWKDGDIKWVTSLFRAKKAHKTSTSIYATYLKKEKIIVSEIKMKEKNGRNDC